MSPKRRRDMVKKEHPRLSIRRQCQVLDLDRSTYYYRPQGESPFNLELMHQIDELFMEAVQHHGGRLLRGRSERGLTRYGVPEIFNTDQGSQFTSREFTRAFKDAGAPISMDGRGRRPDIKMSSFQRERFLWPANEKRRDP